MDDKAWLIAEITQLEEILGQIPDTNVIEKITFMQRLRNAEEELCQLST